MENMSRIDERTWKVMPRYVDDMRVELIESNSLWPDSALLSTMPSSNVQRFTTLALSDDSAWRRVCSQQVNNNKKPRVSYLNSEPSCLESSVLSESARFTWAMPCFVRRR